MHHPGGGRSEEEFARGNELYVAERYQEARQCFGRAIESNPLDARFHLHRAAANLMLRQFEDALGDAERALQIDSSSSTAFYRKGVALFHVGRMGDALGCFEEAARLGHDVGTWPKKCKYELEEFEARPPKIQDPERKAEPPRLREDFYQLGQKVTLTVFCKGLKVEKATVQPLSVDLDLKTPDGRLVQRHYSLYDEVHSGEGEWSLEVTPYKVEISLKKVHISEWPSLERKTRDGDLHGAASKRATRQNVAAQGNAGGPYVGKKPQDWAALDQQVKKDEDEEKPEGDAALEKLLKQIYASADDDTRRAMIKSYQTSGGTVLSTNWQDVRSRDYEKEMKEGTLFGGSGDRPRPHAQNSED